MSSNHTEHYNLSQWERTDQVLMDDFNADNAKIDGALGELAAQVSGKADASTLTAAMQSRNCQAVTTGYTGTGVSGESNPNHLSFARRPLFIHVGGEAASGFSAVYGQTLTACYASGAVRYIRITWSGNSVSWYEDNDGYKASPEHQMNGSGVQYKVFALLSV